MAGERCDPTGKRSVTQTGTFRVSIPGLETSRVTKVKDLVEDEMIERVKDPS